MNLELFPPEILNRCFFYLDTEFLIQVILDGGVPHKIFLAAAINLKQYWFSDNDEILYSNHLANSGAICETNWNRFNLVHKKIRAKSLVTPLWFQYSLDSHYERNRMLDQLKNFAGEDFRIHCSLKDICLKRYSAIPSPLWLALTHLSVDDWNESILNLNDFSRLREFHGCGCEIIVTNSHLTLQKMNLNQVVFDSLPIQLKELVAVECTINLSNEHPCLCNLDVLIVDKIKSSIEPIKVLKKLWNHHISKFSFRNNNIDEEEVVSMLTPSMKHICFDGPVISLNLNNLSVLTLSELNQPLNLSSLRKLHTFVVDLLKIRLHSLKLSPNLLKLSIRASNNKPQNISDFKLPISLIHFELTNCGISLTDGWTFPNISRLTLNDTLLEQVNLHLPCCKELLLQSNRITNVELNASILRNLDLSENCLKEFPDIPSSVGYLQLNNNSLNLSNLPKFSSNLKHLSLLNAGRGRIYGYTFPASIEELRLTEVDLSELRDVKFEPESRLKKLNMSSSRLHEISDTMITLPDELESLDLYGNGLESMNGFSLPNSLRFLDLGRNDLKFLDVSSHWKVLVVNDNPISNLSVPYDLDLRVLDIEGTGVNDFSFDLFPTTKLEHLRLDSNIGLVDFSKMGDFLEVLEYNGQLEFEEFKKYNDAVHLRRKINIA